MLKAQLAKYERNRFTIDPPLRHNLSFPQLSQILPPKERNTSTYSLPNFYGKEWGNSRQDRICTVSPDDFNHPTHYVLDKTKDVLHESRHLHPEI